MENLLQDLRYGLRGLLKRPGFSAIVIITLALGIGANTTVFSVVNGVLLNPLPFKEPDNLTILTETYPGYDSVGVAYRSYTEWRDRSSAFEAMAAFKTQDTNFEVEGTPEQVIETQVTPNYFSVMGLTPVLGRIFTEGEDKLGSQKVVILREGIWRRLFGAQPDIISRTIRMNGEAYTVVGIMPAGLADSSIGWTDIWTPLVINEKEEHESDFRYYSVNARIKAGVSIERARTEIESIHKQLEADSPQTHASYGVRIVPMHQFLVGEVRSALFVLLGAVAFVLLIGCANVANLLLARAASRSKEMSVRRALGASLGRLFRLVLTESLLLAIVGAIFGIVLAMVGLMILRSLSPDIIPRISEIGIDIRVLIFTLSISLLTGLIFGIAPALSAARADINEVLKEGTRGSTSASHRRLHTALVVVEVALALVLLIGSGLMIKSFMRLSEVDPGFNPDKVLRLDISLPDLRYQDIQRKVSFYRQLLERINSLPGVASSEVIRFLPLQGGGAGDVLIIEGQPEPLPGQERFVNINGCSANYFQMMGISLVKGRSFTEQETWEPSEVVIINETLARQFWPGEEPIGKRLRHPDNPWLTVIGVIKDVKQSKLTEPAEPETFRPYASYVRQTGFGGTMSVLARTNSSPETLISAVRNEVLYLDKVLPVSNVMPLQDVVNRSVGGQRFNLILLSAFAAVALLLAAVGIYSVMAYSVTQRTHEIGIRLALGAQTTQILKQIIWQGTLLALVGTVIGVVGAYALTRIMATMLYDVSSTDPLTFTILSVVLIAVSVIACYVPARRATKVDPAIVLRYE